MKGSLACTEVRGEGCWEGGREGGWGRERVGESGEWWEGEREERQMIGWRV